MNERANGKSGMNKRKGNNDENLSPIILEVHRSVETNPCKHIYKYTLTYRLFFVSSFFRSFGFCNILTF